MKRAQNIAPSAVRAALLGACAIGEACADTSTGVANALQNGLARCAAIAGRDDRLACYDALASQRPSSAEQASDGAFPSARPPGRPVAGAPAASALAAMPAGTTASAAPAESIRPEDFGLSPAQRGLPDKQIMSITARVVGFARSIAGRALIELDNGQSWELDEADPLLSSGDSVTIRRAALGSFLLTTPTKRTHRVHRTL